MTETRIVVGTDFSSNADAAFEVALQIAEQLGAKLDLIHALDVPVPLAEPFAAQIPEFTVPGAREDARSELTKRARRAEAKGITVTETLSHVPAASAIADHAAKIGADLIVIGTQGLTGLKRLIVGSVAQATVKRAPCSVLTFRPRSDES